MLTAEIDHRKGRIVLDGVQYRDREPLKLLAGHTFKDNQHSIPLSWPSLKVLLATFPEGVEVGTELRGWAWVEYGTRIGPAVEAHERAMDPENDVSGEIAIEIDELERCRG